MAVPEEPVKKLHSINVKGYFTKMFYDTLQDKKYCDVTYGYNVLGFIGTDEELQEYRNYLVENEGKFGFKLI